MVRVLVLMTDKKRDKLFTRDALDHLAAEDIQIILPGSQIPLLDDRDLPPPESVDVILHKLVDFSPRCNRPVRDRIEAILQRYGHSLAVPRSTSRILLMDRFDRVARLNDRILMCSFITSFLSQ